ncbi:hypothetical protein D3H65_08130 [Paraflavitalea soli]|uniref:DUF5000 domain-containing protein n=1 Tax=Paraflavitalea soli TaxID=2315862 RepID=A0A3B7MHS8_9BACT|nr:DUF4998 domain-containing protein [Paraflavitalea soli]AXY73952.1 hypothetical protein D3H65_08130 [Paraflavitalea soli]
MHSFKKVTASLLIIAAALSWASCTREDDWKKYVPEKPRIYPGTATNPVPAPGKNRIKLTWQLVSDPTITQAKVFWNNGNDSAGIAVARTQGVDTVSIIIDKLQETSYTFDIFTYDKEGNKSVPVYASGRVYGSKYEASLLNRPVMNVNYMADAKILVIAWGTADTVHTGTKLWYTNESGSAQELTVDANTYSTIIPWKVGTKIYYQSSYKPVDRAIDTFTVLKKDSITVKDVPVPKTAWSKFDLPNDVAGDAYGTNLAWIWDGKGGDYPEIYHTGGEGIPHHFTIDLGALYQLTKFENIGRVNANPYHNPTKFEVWGIADITNAATTLPGSDPGWKDESLAKGWVLLKDIVRPDNGTAPYKTDLLPGIPKVRYIRIRVLETIDHDQDSHMSEISFWFNP